MVKKDSDIFIINGCIKKTREDIVPVKNSGFLYGDGCFETMRAYKGNIFLFDEHISRIYSSLCFFKYENIDFVSFKEEIIKNIRKLFYEKDLIEKDASVKVIVSRGEYKKRLDFKSTKGFMVAIFADAYSGYPADDYKKGIKVIVSSIKREEKNNDIYRHKTLNYLESVYAKNEAISRGAAEALFVSAGGTVLEGAVSNIFMVSDNILLTTSMDFNILPGITRKKILELCLKNNIEFNECRLCLDDFFKADEIFITNSLAEILPVSSIEGFNLKGQVPGKLTSRLSDLYRKETLSIVQEESHLS